MSDKTRRAIRKQEYQDKVNPGHQTKYDQPPRPRSAVFKSDKDYDRSKNKKEIDDACRDADIYRL
jgi:uncharacterized C2H2 Zn-finger protein